MSSHSPIINNLAYHPILISNNKTKFDKSKGKFWRSNLYLTDTTIQTQLFGYCQVNLFNLKSIFDYKYVCKLENCR